VWAGTHTLSLLHAELHSFGQRSGILRSLIHFELIFVPGEI
jgi:hypothetical protein